MDSDVWVVCSRRSPDQRLIARATANDGKNLSLPTDREPDHRSVEEFVAAMPHSQVNWAGSGTLVQRLIRSRSENH